MPATGVAAADEAPANPAATETAIVSATRRLGLPFGRTMDLDRDTPHPPSSGQEKLSRLASPSWDIASTSSRIGHYVWLSSRLFEEIGAWATSADDPPSRVRFAGVARRFAWQAAQWRDRLPRLREVEHQSLIVAPDEGISAFIDGLAATPRPVRPTTLLGVIQGLDDLYTAHEAVVSPLRDGSILRTLRRVRADLADLHAEFSDIGHTEGISDP